MLFYTTQNEERICSAPCQNKLVQAQYNMLKHIETIGCDHTRTHNANSEVCPNPRRSEKESQETIQEPSLSSRILVSAHHHHKASRRSRRYLANNILDESDPL